MPQLRIALVVISFILSVLIGLTLARGRQSLGAQGPGPVARPLVIGLSMDTLKEARWETDRDLFVARAKELGAEVKVQSANSNDSTQVENVKAFIGQRVDAVVIIPHNGGAMSEAVKECQAAGIPVLAYDRLIPDCRLDLYVTFDNVKVGEAQAQYLVDHLPTPGKGKIVRIYGAPTDNNAKMFKQGQDNVLKPYLDRGDIVVVHEDWATDWSPSVAKEIMAAAVAKNGLNFDGVLASNDGTAGGAISVLSDAKASRRIVVTGQDADLAACQRIVEGSQAMSVYKPIKDLAPRAAELAVALAKKEKPATTATVNNGTIDVPSVLLKIISVDKSNILETVVKDGFKTYDDVYVNVPAAQRPPKP